MLKVPAKEKKEEEETYEFNKSDTYMLRMND